MSAASSNAGSNAAGAAASTSVSLSSSLSSLSLDAFRCRPSLALSSLLTPADAATKLTAMCFTLLPSAQGTAMLALGSSSSSSSSSASVAVLGFDSGLLLSARLTSSASASPAAALTSVLTDTTNATLLAKKKISKKPITSLEIVYLRLPADTQQVNPFKPSSHAPRPSLSASIPTLTKPFLLALVDSKLLLLDISTLSTVLEIAPKESFSLFCVDPTPHPVLSSAASAQQAWSTRIVGAIKGKKKLQMYALIGSSGANPPKCDLMKELLVPDVVLSMAAQGDCIAIGYKREYSLLSITTDNATDVPVPVEGISPLLVRCAANELLLATTNCMGFFVSFDGEPLPKAPLLWANQPLTFQPCGGYILAAMLEGANAKGEGGCVSVAISSMLDQKQVQIVRLPIRSTAGSGPPALFLTPHPTHDILLLAVSSVAGSEFYQLSQTSASEQIEQYMEYGFASEASALFLQTNPSQDQLEEFNARAGFVCLRELDFMSAFEHFFQQSEVDPRELLALFPDLQMKSMPFSPSKQWNNILQANYMQTSKEAPVPSMQMLIDAARARIASKEKSMASSLDAAGAASNANAAAGGAGAAGASSASSAAGSSNVGGSSRVRRKEILESSPAALLRSARFHLAQFLWTWREKHAKPASSSQQQQQQEQGDVEQGVCVDTALLYLAVEHAIFKMEQQSTALSATSTGTKGRNESIDLSSPHSDAPSFPYTLQQLFFPSNQCLMHESELFLSRERQYNSLALLFQSKQALRKALEVWRNLGEGKFKSREFSSSASTATTGGFSTSPSPSHLPGLSETVSLLSTLPDQPLLWEFAEWVLTASPADGLRIFLTPRQHSQLPPEKVLTFLKKVAINVKAQANTDRLGGIDGEYAVVGSGSSGSSSTRGEQPLDLVEAYLEYLIASEKTKESKYHTQLALAYLRKVTTLSVPPFRSSGSSEKLPAGTIQRFRPGHEPALRGPPRSKLLKFLQRSEQYDAAVVLHALVELHALTSSSVAGRSRAGSAVNTPASTGGLNPPSIHSATTTYSWSGPPFATSPNVKASYSGLDPSKHESNLYEELLLLLSRLGLHTRVLQIYIFDLHDEVSAAAYAHYIARKTQIAQTARKEADRRAAAQASLYSDSENGDGRGGNDNFNQNHASNGGGNSADGSHQDNTLRSSSDEESHSGDVLLDLLNIYFSNEYEQLCRERETTSTSAAAPQHEAALDLLNQFYHMMDPVKLIQILPPTLPLSSLTHLFSRLMPQSLHARRDGRVVSGLHKMSHLRTQGHCFALRSISLPLDQSSKCGWCYKALNDSVFVAHPYHRLRDPITKKYVIDFEQGAAATAATPSANNASSGGGGNTSASQDWLDPFGDQAGFRCELPKFVLVHLHCSAHFLANGGSEAYASSGSGSNSGGGGEARGRGIPSASVSVTSAGSYTSSHGGVHNRMGSLPASGSFGMGRGLKA